MTSIHLQHNHLVHVLQEQNHPVVEVLPVRYQLLPGVQVRVVKARETSIAVATDRAAVPATSIAAVQVAAGQIAEASIAVVRAGQVAAVASIAVAVAGQAAVAAHTVEAAAVVDVHPAVVAVEDNIFKVFLKKINLYEKDYITPCNKLYCRMGLRTRRNGRV